METREEAGGGKGRQRGADKEPKYTKCVSAVKRGEQLNFRIYTCFPPSSRTSCYRSVSDKSILSAFKPRYSCTGSPFECNHTYMFPLDWIGCSSHSNENWSPQGNSLFSEDSVICSRTPSRGWMSTRSQALAEGYSPCSFHDTPTSLPTLYSRALHGSLLFRPRLWLLFYRLYSPDGNVAFKPCSGAPLQLTQTELLW